MLKQMAFAALAAVGLALSGPAAQAQSLTIGPNGVQYNPGGMQQYYSPYTYGSNSYYYPNSGYAYSYPYSSGYSSSYYGPTVYGPGYTANYPYMYNQYNYGYTNPYSYYNNSYYNTYRTWRWR